MGYLKRMDVLPEIEANLTDHQRKLVAEAVSWLLRKRNVPEREIREMVYVLTRERGTTAMFERLPMYDVQQVCEEGRVEGRKKDRVEESLNGPSRSVTITKDGV